MIQSYLCFIKSIITTVIKVTAIIVSDNGLMLKVSDLNVVIMVYFVAIRMTYFNHMKAEVRNVITEIIQLLG